MDECKLTEASAGVTERPTTEVERLRAEVRQLKANSPGGACESSEAQGSSASSGEKGNEDELAELDATIRNAQADVAEYNGRLAKETSDHHKRNHQ